MQGAVTTGAPTYTTAQTSPLSLDTAGNLRVAGTFTPSGTQDENLKQVNGVTVNVGIGTASTGTQRVAVASDSSIVIATGSNTIGALTANQSVNVAQINGVTTLMGNGVTGTGSQRVTIASDNTPFAIKVDQTTPGTTNAVSLAQIGATTVASGNGVVGAGVQRVAIASDNTAFVVVPAGANGTAVHSVTNPVWSKLTDGTNALGTGSNPLIVSNEGAAAGTLADTGLLTSAALAAGGNATLTATAVTSGTAKLLEITASSSVRIKVEVQTFVSASPTTKRVFFVDANQNLTYQPRDRDAITFAGASGNLFQLKITNMDNSLAADVYGSITQENV